MFYIGVATWSFRVFGEYLELMVVEHVEHAHRVTQFDCVNIMQGLKLISIWNGPFFNKNVTLKIFKVVL